VQRSLLGCYALVHMVGESVGATIEKTQCRTGLGLPLWFCELGFCGGENVYEWSEQQGVTLYPNLGL
jgi:hypothetical protein